MCSLPRADVTNNHKLPGLQIIEILAFDSSIGKMSGERTSEQTKLIVS